MSFSTISDRLDREKELREEIVRDRLFFGIRYLDVATRGIANSDVVVIGGPSGSGKTEITTQIALSNVRDGKRVHFIALEAEECEIERRILYSEMAQRYFSDPDRPRLLLSFDRWKFGEYGKVLDEYENQAREFMRKGLINFHVFYKMGKNFHIKELLQNTLSIAKETDLILIDHAHYFDWGSENELKALRDIAKKCEEITAEIKRPIILVAQFRKNRQSDDLVPPMEEFHGSSDLIKVGKQIITFTRASTDSNGRVPTYFRVCKARSSGNVIGCVGKMHFNFKTKTYDQEVEVGPVDKIFGKFSEYPDWAKELEGPARLFGDSGKDISGQPRLPYNE